MALVLWYLDLHILRQSELITTKCIDFDSKARNGHSIQHYGITNFSDWSVIFLIKYLPR